MCILIYPIYICYRTLVHDACASIWWVYRNHKNIEVSCTAVQTWNHLQHSEMFRPRPMEQRHHIASGLEAECLGWLGKMWTLKKVDMWWCFLDDSATLTLMLYLASSKVMSNCGRCSIIYIYIYYTYIYIYIYMTVIYIYIHVCIKCHWEVFFPQDALDNFCPTSHYSLGGNFRCRGPSDIFSW